MVQVSSVTWVGGALICSQSLADFSRSKFHFDRVWWTWSALIWAAASVACNWAGSSSRVMANRVLGSWWSWWSCTGAVKKFGRFHDQSVTSILAGCWSALDLIITTRDELDRLQCYWREPTMLMSKYTSIAELQVGVTESENNHLGWLLLAIYFYSSLSKSKITRSNLLNFAMEQSSEEPFTGWATMLALLSG